MKVLLLTKKVAKKQPMTEAVRAGFEPAIPEGTLP